ncbi:MAG: hypothetical protein ACE5FA_05090 [Dehalococcoidia bacterium]
MPEPTQAGAPPAPSEPQTPAEPQTQLGSNEFQERWEQQQSVLPQPGAASGNPESGQPSNEGAPEQGSPAPDVTSQPDPSFLTEEERAQLNTESPEYKIMQAAYTKRMQELKAQDATADANKALQDRIQRLEAQLQGDAPQAPPDQSLSFEEFRSAAPLSDELSPYRDEIIGLVREAAEYTVNQLQQQAVAAQEYQMRSDFQSKLQTELADLQSGPDASDFQRHYQEVVNVATENPNLISRVGLKGVLDMVRGYTTNATPPPAAQPQTQQTYASGVEDTLARMQAAKTAAVDNHQPVGGAIQQAQFAIPENTSLNNAVQMAFEQAKRGHG